MHHFSLLSSTVHLEAYFGFCLAMSDKYKVFYGATQKGLFAHSAI